MAVIGSESSLDKVPDHLVLRVDRDRAARQIPKIDAMTAPVEAKFDTFMHHPEPAQAFAAQKEVTSVNSKLSPGC